MTGAVITVLMDLPATQAYRVATLEALAHAEAHVGAGVRVQVVPTAAIDGHLISDPGDGVMVGPGSPYDNPEGVLEVIRTARQRGVPLVGT